MTERQIIDERHTYILFEDEDWRVNDSCTLEFLVLMIDLCQ